ncbi:MAG: nitroreductase/quinone reductase family protein [Polyangiales bacterium]
MNPYQKLMEKIVATRLGAHVALRIATPIDRHLLRFSGGRISSGLGTDFGKNLCLLTCRGAKTGKLRSVPLLHTRLGDDVVLVASKGASEVLPAWYHNLKKNPDCEIEIRGQCTKRRAREALGAERDRLFDKAVSTYAGYAVHQDRIHRPIPVMVLERVNG